MRSPKTSVDTFDKTSSGSTNLIMNTPSKSIIVTQQQSQQPNCPGKRQIEIVHIDCDEEDERRISSEPATNKAALFTAHEGSITKKESSSSTSTPQKELKSAKKRKSNPTNSNTNNTLLNYFQKKN